jgi:hypothetical protein
MVRQRLPALQPEPVAPIETTGLRNGSRRPAVWISVEAGLIPAAGLLSWTEAATFGRAAVFGFAASFTRTTGLTAAAFTVAGLVATCATAGFGPALLAFTETEFCGVPFATGTAVCFTRTPTVGALFAGMAFGPAVVGFAAGTGFAVGSTLAGFAAVAFTETAFAAGVVDAVFVPAEIVLGFGFDTAGFPEACTEGVFAVESTGFTETAAFAFGATLVAVAFAPFGEGLPVCAALLVAG